MRQRATAGSVLRRVGASSGGDGCFADNACVAVALGQDKLWRAGADPRLEIRGVLAEHAGSTDLLTPDTKLHQVLENDYGRSWRTPATDGVSVVDGFRDDIRPGVYSIREMEEFRSGVPIKSNPAEIQGFLKLTGDDAQGLTLATIDPDWRRSQPRGDALDRQAPDIAAKLDEMAKSGVAHMFNVRQRGPRLGDIEVLDRTQPGTNMFEIPWVVKDWLFYPTTVPLVRQR
jgi:hypothetical protein